MKVAVLSGKGGAGKTCISVNLAALAKEAVYIDCDVEEPNGRLFLKPETEKQSEVFKCLPAFNGDLCDGCRKCVEFCKFNALIFIKKKPVVFDEVCHSCGGCLLVCPNNAITETKRSIGVVEKGRAENCEVVTGVLNTGEESGVPVIKRALEIGSGDAACEDNGATSENHFVVVDCPPGSACSVTESVSDADYCLIVAEPTAFGFHNFQMVHRLTKLLGKKCGVVINKMEAAYEPLEQYCQDEQLEILARIPYSQEAAEAISNGELLLRKDVEFRNSMQEILRKIGGEAQ